MATIVVVFFPVECRAATPELIDPSTSRSSINFSERNYLNLTVALCILAVGLGTKNLFADTFRNFWLGCHCFFNLGLLLGNFE